MEVELPNGVVIEDVPEGTTKEQIKAQAISAGLATEADFGGSATTSKPESSFGSELMRQLGLTVRGGVTAITSLPTMVADAPALVANAIAGREVATPASKTLQRGMTSIGLPEPKNDQERLVQAGVVGMASPMAASKILPAVGLTEAGKQFVPNAVRQAVSSAGAGAGAEFGAQEAAKEDLSPVESFGYSLLYGILGGAAGSAASNWAKAANNKLASTSFGQKLGATTLDKPVTIKDVKDTAKSFYDKVDKSGVSVYSGRVVGALDKMEKTLPNYIPEMATHRPIQLVFDRIKKDIADNPGPINFSRLDGYRKGLAKIAAESNEPATKNMARAALEQYDDFVGGLSARDLRGGAGELKETLSNLSDARSAWKRVANATKISNIVEDAQIKAEASNGTLNFSDAVKAEFKKLALDDKKLQGFTPDEKIRIRELSSSKLPEDALRILSRFDPRKPGFGAAMVTGSAISAGAGNATMGAIGGGLAASGFLSEAVLKNLKQKATTKLQQDILKGTIERPKNTERVQALLQSYINKETESYVREKKKEEAKKEKTKAKKEAPKDSPPVEVNGKMFPTERSMSSAVSGTVDEGLTEEDIITGALFDNPSLSRSEIMRRLSAGVR